MLTRYRDCCFTWKVMIGIVIYYNFDTASVVHQIDD